MPEYGYHSKKIEKGVYGELSKVREEMEELEDAVQQGVRIMAMCELADLIGAIRAYADTEYGLSLKDLLAMDKVTREAFEKGVRT